MMFTSRSSGKVGVEAYAAYALRTWLARDPMISDRTRRFARWPAIFSNQALNALARMISAELAGSG